MQRSVAVHGDWMGTGVALGKKLNGLRSWTAKRQTRVQRERSADRRSMAADTACRYESVGFLRCSNCTSLVARAASPMHALTRLLNPGEPGALANKLAPTVLPARCIDLACPCLRRVVIR